MGFVCNNKMHIQSCMFNFLSKLESYIEFDGFLGYKGLTWIHIKIILQRERERHLKLPQIS
jgi:hypothetical protein